MKLTDNCNVNPAPCPMKLTDNGYVNLIWYNVYVTYVMSLFKIHLMNTKQFFPMYLFKIQRMNTNICQKYKPKIDTTLN